MISTGGLLLLRPVERRRGLWTANAEKRPDPRRPRRVKHTAEEMLRQRVFGLGQGDEDRTANDLAALLSLALASA